MSLHTDVVKRFLGGTTLERIKRDYKIDDRTVFQILKENTATNALFDEQARKFLNGEFAPFFSKTKAGRSKLPKEKLRKLRQIRISDAEMGEMDNPSSSKMRNMMLDYHRISKFLEYLDKEGVKLFPDDIFHEEYDPSDPLWSAFLYSKNENLLRKIASDERRWEQVKEVIG